MSNRFQLSMQVQKKLKDLDLNAEDVIRKALDVRPEGFEAGDGINLPEGSVLMAWYKDSPHTARVREGTITVNGAAFNSLSGAAASITGRPTTNGWDFWTIVKFPAKNEFVPLKSLRKAS